MIYYNIAKVLWLLFILYWFASSLGVKQIAKRENPLYTIIVMLCMGGGFYALLSPTDAAVPDWQGILGVILCIVGIAFGIWARVALGKNWSGTATVQKDHELIQTGPYAITRHPIYTGWLLGLLGAAITLGEWQGYLGVLLVFIAFSIKMWQEERLMQEQFPLDYAKYKRNVKKLIPGIW